MKKNNNNNNNKNIFPSSCECEILLRQAQFREYCMYKDERKKELRKENKGKKIKVLENLSYGGKEIATQLCNDAYTHDVLFLHNGHFAIYRNFKESEYFVSVRLNYNDDTVELSVCGMNVSESLNDLREYIETSNRHGYSSYHWKEITRLKDYTANCILKYRIEWNEDTDVFEELFQEEEFINECGRKLLNW